MVYVTEYSSPAWIWLYWLSLLLSACMLATAIIGHFKEKIHKTPFALLISGAVGALYMLGFPFNIYVWMAIHTGMKNLNAPIGALFISGIFSLSCWLLSVRGIVAKRI